MEQPPVGTITRCLQDWSDGEAAAEEQLFEMVYSQLGRLATNRLRGERESHTLETSALVHEAFLKLVDQKKVRWKDRAHFFSIAARIMRRVLVDHARRQNSSKRGGDCIKVRVSSQEQLAGSDDPDLLALDDALVDLERRDPELAHVVLLRTFGGMTKEEAAEAIGTSPRTLARKWRMARAWLYSYLVSGNRDEL